MENFGHLLPVIRLGRTRFSRFDGGIWFAKFSQGSYISCSEPEISICLTLPAPLRCSQHIISRKFDT